MTISIDCSKGPSSLLHFYFWEIFLKKRMAPNNFHQKTTEKLSDFIKYSGSHDEGVNQAETSLLVISRVQVHPLIFWNHVRNQEKKLNQMSKKTISIFWNGLHPSHDMSKCEKMRYADLLQEGILENMTTFSPPLIYLGTYLGLSLQY